MLRTIGIIIGILFIFFGVAGFFPQMISNGLLFGYFALGNLSNLVHIVTGVLAIMAATSYASTRLYFQIFGVIYAIVAIIGFVNGGDLYIMQVNTADNVFHLIFALVSLYLGFIAKI